MGIRIIQSTNPQDVERINPNFIYNRFDLFCNDDEYKTVIIQNNGTEKVVEYRISGTTAELALWLVPVSKEEIKKLLFYIKKNHPEIQKITYKNGLHPYGKSVSHNHFRIVFPETVEEVENLISGKSKAKMKKKLRRAENAYGEMRYIEYDRSNLPDEVVEKFFEYKLITRKRRYNMTPEQYLDRYHVSHCYVLIFGDTYGAIRFSCEQCPVVYGENFTFNPELQEYSLGRAIFMHHLKRMVEKGHPELFFAGGNFEYKTHYNSIEETLYDCEIKTADLDFSVRLKKRLSKFIKKHKVLNKLKNHIKKACR